MSVPATSSLVLTMSGLTNLNAQFLLRTDFMSFVRYTFGELHAKTELVESSHLPLIAAKLEECAAGTCKRLIVCLPPRSLKSIIVSVALPAWLLGNQPHTGIICASYGQDLADKHAMDTRTVMNSRGYQRAFGTRLSPQKRAVGEFVTTAGGFRLATSVGGVLTGRGGDFIIIDDPLKPQDAHSEPLRTAANHWYDSTLSSRLNDKENGVVIIVMQRLHQDDLIGHLMAKGEWDVLRLPAIAEEDEILKAVAWHGAVLFERKEGDVLDPRRESLPILRRQQAEMGIYDFEAQYQQNPQPPGGAIVKTKWLLSYTPAQLPPRFAYKIQSWDTANKGGELNDYSVSTTWGVFRNSAIAGGTAGGELYYLLDVYRERLEFPALERAVREQHAKHSPHWVVVEDKGSGTQIIQNFARSAIRVKPYAPATGSDKRMRLFAQSALFENGRVLLPASAPWLDEYIRELTSFPGAKHDDQVDSTTQALDHLSKARRYRTVIREFCI